MDASSWRPAPRITPVLVDTELDAPLSPAAGHISNGMCEFLEGNHQHIASKTSSWHCLTSLQEYLLHSQATAPTSVPIQHRGSSIGMGRKRLRLPPQTPFSPSPISDKNPKGRMNSMASMTCSDITRSPVHCTTRIHRIEGHYLSECKPVRCQGCTVCSVTPALEAWSRSDCCVGMRPATLEVSPQDRL